jgi:PAS domain S-box-containing protein
MEHFGNASILERPTRVASLVSAARSALRARRRQYQIRDHLLQRERDISQAKQAAEALRSAQEQLQEVTDNMAVAVAHCSRDFRYLWVSPGCTAWLKRSKESMVGRSIPDVLGEAAFAAIRPHIEKVLAGSRVEFEQQVPYQDLGTRWVKASYVPTHDKSGQVDGWVAVLMDTTAHHQMEEALREADRRKDEFLAVLAHELRNPLAPIRNSLNILRLTHQDDEAADEVCEMMERQVNHMVRLVDDLLEVSRITRGKIVLQKEPVELAAVIRSAVEASRPLIDDARHRLALSIPAEPLTIEGDAVRLSQIFSNLLNNAAKYTDEGGQIWLSVRVENNEAVIVVRDTGTGISADMLPRIFELFTQLDVARGRSQGGLGIGLTLVKSLVELHGGRVTASSPGIGKGSEFVVRLPLIAASQGRSVESRIRPTKVLASRRVLVVDDNRDAAESLGKLLSLLGAQVQVVFSGEEALEAVRVEKPVAILLDIGMPEMNGYDVAREIRSDPENRDITLIALTGWGQEQDRRRSQDAGFDHHLVKPVNSASLLELLQSVP